MSSSNDNRAIVIRFFEEVWNAGHGDTANELLAPTYVGHERNAPDVQGVDGMKQTALAFRANFPDATFAITDVVAETAKVVLQLRLQATHILPLWGTAPTGRQLIVSGTIIYRLVEGRIVESWSNWDELGLLLQLGGRIVFEPPQA